MGLEKVSKVLLILSPETINIGVYEDEMCSNKMPLHFAAEKGLTEICSLILEIIPEAISATTTGLVSNGMTAGHFAAKNGHVETCRMLLEKKPELINILDDSHHTLLNHAASEGHKEVCELILKIDPKNAMISYEGFTALHCAAIGASKDNFELLLQHVNQEIIDSVCQGIGSVLHCAAIGGNKEICKIQLSIMDTKLINLPNGLEYLPLHLATNHNQSKVSEVERKEACEILIDTMQVSEMAKLLSRSEINLPVQEMVSKIIAEFISTKFSANVVNPRELNSYQIKLLKLYQVVDLLPKDQLPKAYLSEDIPFREVNNFITTHYFNLAGVCRSLNIDSPISILMPNSDCISYILNYLSPSLYAEHFDKVTKILGTVQEPLDN